MRYYTSLLVLLVTICIPDFGQSQGIFGKAKKAFGKKVTDHVEDRVVDEIATRLANAAIKPIDKALDDWFESAYKEEYGKEYEDDGDPEKRQEAMNNMLRAIYGTVELPESYDFTYEIRIDLTDYDEKKAHDMHMYLNPEGKLFGVKHEDEGVLRLMVFDIGNDNMVIFNDEDMTAIAMPNVMKMARVFGSTTEFEVNAEHYGKFEKINKSKKVAGYPSQGYKYESESDKGEFFVSTALPFDWNETFGTLIESISVNFYKENPEYAIEGMLMYSKAKRKSDGKESKWEVKEVKSSAYAVECSKYELANTTMGQ